MARATRPILSMATGKWRDSVDVVELAYDGRPFTIGGQRQHPQPSVGAAPAIRSSAGISLTQGAHQVAQKFTTSPWPRRSASDFSLPSASINAVVGMCFPSFAGWYLPRAGGGDAQATGAELANAAPFSRMAAVNASFRQLEPTCS